MLLGAALRCAAQHGIGMAGMASGSSDEVAARMEAVQEEFARYLQSYTAASVALLGRWPTFLSEDERSAEALEVEDLSPFMHGPEMPPGLRVEAQPSTLAERGGARRRPSEGSQQNRPPSQPVSVSGTEVSIREDDLRGAVEKLSGKLRHEVHARTQAADESMRRGTQLQALQREALQLQETVKRQSQQLEHAREVTLKLEEELREGKQNVESADSRLVKERKERHKWRLRAERLEKRIDPLEAEAKVLISRREIRGRARVVPNSKPALERRTTSRTTSCSEASPSGRGGARRTRRRRRPATCPAPRTSARSASTRRRPTARPARRR